MLGTRSDDRHERARLERGLAGHGMDRGTEASRGEAGLERLGDAKGAYDAGEGRPDIRGWAVIASDGRRIGKVHDLLVDGRERRLRWLDVEIDRATVRSGEARCVLVPVGEARVDAARRQVRLSRLSGAAIARLPGCEHGAVSRHREREILAQLRQLADPAADDAHAPAELPGAEADFYDHPHFRDRDLWG